MRRVRLLAVFAIVIVLLLAAVPASAAPASGGPTHCIQWYRVRCGDTLSRIAAWYGTSTGALARWNGIWNPNVIYAGQTLCVRWGAPPHPHPGGFWYQVQCGDMLRLIAARYGWGTWQLANVNGITNPDRIYAGQMLWIPAH